MRQPAYLSAVNIRCIANCPQSQIVKSNGVTVATHTVLTHKFSAGETAAVCRNCARDARRMEALTGPEGNWRVSKVVEVQNGL